MDRELSISHCMTCNNCQTQCPVLAHFPDFPGPKYLGPFAERHRLKNGSPDLDNFLSYCTNCKRCDNACPHNVSPARYNLINRSHCRETPLRSLRNFILAHNVWWGMGASQMPGFANWMLNLAPVRLSMSMMGIAERKFPAFKKRSHRGKEMPAGRKILYFPGCYARFNEPAIIDATTALLSSCGCSADIAPLNCCGIPMLTNSLMSESKKIAAHNADVLIGYIERGYTVITTCSSCGLALKDEYFDLIPRDRALKVAAATFDLFEFLCEEGLQWSSSQREKIPKAYYHVPCHLKAQATGVPAAGILRESAVSELLVRDSLCCGIAGTYGFKKEKYDLSMKIGGSLFEDIRKEAPDVVITDCGTCAIQIHQGTGIRVTHPVIALQES